MRYWIISPNVSAIPLEQPLWEKAIFEKHLALMGWDDSHEIGVRFRDEIQLGDFVLIAQGANRNKRLFLGGLVTSNAVWEKTDNTPRETYNRKLTPVLLKTELENLGLNFNGSAYGDADRIPALYVLHPHRNEADKQIADLLSDATAKKIKSMKMQELLKLLSYKKQVILQGPPGTGKTKLAKELASELVSIRIEQTENAATLDKAAIQHILKEISSIKTKSGKDLKIVGVKDGVVDVQTNDSEVWHPSYNKIIDSYNNRLFNDTGRTGGYTPYEDAIAKYLFENHRTPEKEPSSEQVKLIQFHPSYSYEDFVRGIVAESKGDKIEYKNVNKLLGQFAEEALKNWNDFHRDSSSVSKENKTREYFEAFVDDLNDRITNGEKIVLTNSVSLVDVEENAFRYKGADGWSALGNRMLFKDIIQSFLDENKVRQDIKKNNNLSGLAIQHATYFIRVLNMFQDYLQKNNLTFDKLDTNRPELKNYVLIIDEINRANLSSVLGELIYALEYRGEKVESMYAVDGNNALVLPPNLYIIGTMNTADRSVGHIDYAIRRRFAFVDVPPKDLSTELGADFHKALFYEVAALFNNHLSDEFEKKDVQLGHSYFIDKTRDGGSIAIRLQYEIKPLLLEYIRDGVLKDSKELREAIANLEHKIA